MKDFDYKDVDYCKYGFRYRKRTRLWGNINWKPRPLCCKDCGNTVDGKHVETLNAYLVEKRLSGKKTM